MRSFIFALVATAVATPAVAVDFEIATAAQGAAVVRAEDSFTRALSPADLSIRLQDPEGGTVQALTELYAGELRDWSAEERARLVAMIARASVSTRAFARMLPPSVLLVKNTDRLDGGLPHTRGNAIFWGDTLPESDEELDRLFYHELFHVLSRHNAARHAEIYGIIGFVPCVTVTAPDSLRAIMVTNPDAPTVNFVVPAAEGQPTPYLTPILVASSPRWDPAKARFTQYFDLRFYGFTRDAAGHCATVPGPTPYGGVNPDMPIHYDARHAVPMIFAHAGSNTDYVLHPEELMADNFAQLMMGRTDAPNPEIQQRLSQFLGIAPIH